MAVRIRLRRMGKKKQPLFRIVAVDSRVAREGKYLENIGSYNPRIEPTVIEINRERAMYWLSRGAQPSNTVRSLLRRRGIMLEVHLRKLGKDEAYIGEEIKKWEVLQLDRQKRVEALREQRKLKRKASMETAATPDVSENPPEPEAASEAE